MAEDREAEERVVFEGTVRGSSGVVHKVKLIRIGDECLVFTEYSSSEDGIKLLRDLMVAIDAELGMYIRATAKLPPWVLDAIHNVRGTVIIKPG